MNKGNKILGIGTRKGSWGGVVESKINLPFSV